MKLTLKQLRESYAVLENVATQKPKSAKLGYRLGRILRSAQSEMEGLHKAHIELLEAYGAEKNGEGVLQCPKASLVDFNPAFDELLTTEIELWGEPLTVDEIDGQLELSGIEYAILDWLVVESAPAVVPKAKAAEV